MFNYRLFETMHSIVERKNQTALWQLTTPFQYKKIEDMEWKERPIPLQDIGGLYDCRDELELEGYVEE